MNLKTLHKLSDLNFQSLDNLKTENLNKKVGLYLLLPVIGIAAVLFAGLTRDNEQILNVGLILLASWFALGVLVLVFMAFRAFIITLRSPNYLADFASDNNLLYQKQVSESPTTKPGTIFHVDRTVSQTISDFLHGATDEYTFSCYKYSYCINRGKYGKYYDAVVVEIELPNNVPHIVIDSIIESVNLDIKSSVLPIQFAESQRINLEGNFSRYFAVYSPELQEMNTLALFTPDVMENIMHFASKCDIEMIKNSFISTGRRYRKIVTIMKNYSKRLMPYGLRLVKS